MQNAIDCHVHVIGGAEEFPQSPDRHYLAAPASVADLRTAAAGRATRFVIVQPSFYGTDNAATLAGVALLGEQGRAVAVIDATMRSDATLRSLHAGGVRGLRVNLNSLLRGDTRTLATELGWLGEVARGMGWHIQLVVPFATFAAQADLIARVPVPVVIDHFGLPIGQGVSSPQGRAVLGLAALPHVWVKLSAPYRVLADPLGTTPPRDWLAAYLDAAPDRCVWGSDWPHTPAKAEQRGADATAPYRPISYGALLGDFIAALPEGAASRVLLSNPERLYGFAAAA